MRVVFIFEIAFCITEANPSAPNDRFCCYWGPYDSSVPQDGQLLLVSFRELLKLVW